VRVSQGWAGNQYGMMAIPRIGHEVIVDFIEGDPDRPIITGRVYHGTNKPPYSLPDEKTKSTIKSMSSPDSGGVNEIRFEDKAGEEQLFIHAEKILDHRSKGRSREFVGGGRHMIVAGDQYEKVSGDKHMTVEGDHNEKVSGTISLESEAGDILEKAGINHAIEAQQNFHIKAGINAVIEATAGLYMKVGNSFISIGPAGIDISGSLVNINSGGSPGSGPGCSPQAPKEPEEADVTEPGSLSELPDFTFPQSTPQATAFQQASQAGTAFCEQ
jgi:type VI secretion system secreted protein VgrG